MPLGTITIEQVGPSNWIAEVETGGLVSRCRRLTAGSFGEIHGAVAKTWAELTKGPRVTGVTGPAADSGPLAEAPPSTEQIIAQAQQVTRDIAERTGRTPRVPKRAPRPETHFAPGPSAPASPPVKGPRHIEDTAQTRPTRRTGGEAA